MWPLNLILIVKFDEFGTEKLTCGPDDFVEHMRGLKVICNMEEPLRIRVISLEASDRLSELDVLAEVEVIGIITKVIAHLSCVQVWAIVCDQIYSSVGSLLNEAALRGTIPDPIGKSLRAIYIVVSLPDTPSQ